MADLTLTFDCPVCKTEKKAVIPNFPTDLGYILHRPFDVRCPDCKDQLWFVVGFCCHEKTNNFLQFHAHHYSKPEHQELRKAICRGHVG